MTIARVDFIDAPFVDGPGNVASGEAVDRKLEQLRTAWNALVTNGIAQADLSAAVQQLMFQPGDLRASAAAAIPTGWLDCDGSTQSRTTFSAVYAALGGAASPWGQGDGRTTFTLPDFKGRALIGVGVGTGLTARTMGQGGGAETVTLTTNEMPVHGHTASTGSAGTHSHGGATGATDPQHSHQSPDGRPFLTDRVGIGGGVYDLTGGGDIGNGGGGFTTVSSINHAHTIAADGAHTHTVTVNNAGAGAAHANMPPWRAARILIKT